MGKFRFYRVFVCWGGELGLFVVWCGVSCLFCWDFFVVWGFFVCFGLSWLGVFFVIVRGEYNWRVTFFLITSYPLKPGCVCFVPPTNTRQISWGKPPHQNQSNKNKESQTKPNQNKQAKKNKKTPSTKKPHKTTSIPIVNVVLEFCSVKNEHQFLWLSSDPTV